MKNLYLASVLFLFSFSSASAQEQMPSADYSCTLKYHITNGSILGGGGNVNIEGAKTFDLSYPSPQYITFDENKRHFFAGIYYYDKKVSIEIKVFKEGQPTWQGLLSVVASSFDHFQDKLHISSFINHKEKIEFYQLDCLKKTVSSIR